MSTLKGRPFVGPGGKVEYGSAEWNNYQSAAGSVKSTGSLAEQLAPLKALLTAMLEEKRRVEHEVISPERWRRITTNALLAEVGKLYD